MVLDKLDGMVRERLAWHVGLPRDVPVPNLAHHLALALLQPEKIARMTKIKLHKVKRVLGYERGKLPIAEARKRIVSAIADIVAKDIRAAWPQYEAAVCARSVYGGKDSMP